MPEKIRIADNRRKTLFEVLDSNLPNHQAFSIATCYWDLPGTIDFIDQLENYDSVRLLLGRQPAIPRQAILQPEADFPKLDISTDLERLPFKEEFKTAVSRIRALVESGKLQVKLFSREFLHAKCYVLGGYESTSALGIIGSSNFTRNGLRTNLELNAIEHDERVVLYRPENEKQQTGHLAWFDELWGQADDWSQEFINVLIHSPVGDTLYSPYESYVKTLHLLYEEELDDDPFVQSTDAAYDLFEFQQRNVQALNRKLKKHGVAMLSDSVGLGKTITAIETMRGYADGPLGRQRVVVICPKSLEKQWKKELLKNKLQEVQVVTLQNAGQIEEQREFDQFAAVTLFVIDESHNLRKTNGERYQRIVDWIRNNPKCNVLLVTATPINNELNDLTNQILLGTGGRGDAFRVLVKDGDEEYEAPFASAVRSLQSQIRRQLNAGGQIDPTDIQNVIAPIIRQVVVRRTRQGIMAEYGGLEIDGQLVTFPEENVQPAMYRFGADSGSTMFQLLNSHPTLSELLHYSNDDLSENCTDLKHPLDQVQKLNRLTDDRVKNEIASESPMYFIFQLILSLAFVPYRWRMYRKQYYGKTIQQIRDMNLDAVESRALHQQRGMYGIFRTIFLKRLESSVRAIRISVERYRDKLLVFQEGIDQGQIISIGDAKKIEAALLDGNEADVDLTAFFEDEDSILDDASEETYNMSAIRADIEKEITILDLLLQFIGLLEQEDTKLQKLNELINSLGDQKVLVFSYFSDTVKYLEERLVQEPHTSVSVDNGFFLSSRNRKEANDAVKRFAPIAQEAEDIEPEDQLQYLISTDVLSEGQNLQDCGILINYDLHWNPVRMIQRNGRVNRLGTDFETVSIFNMRPDIQLERYLQLVNRLESKINLIRFTIGTDASILGEAAMPTDFVDDLSDIYCDNEQRRLRALQRMQAAGDFLLAEDVFVQDLKAFDANPDHSEEYKEEIYNMPVGKWCDYPDTELAEDDARPPVLALSGVEFSNAEETAMSYKFLEMQADTSKAKVIPNLKALRWLKTAPSDNERQADRIELDRTVVKAKASAKKSFSRLDDDAPTPPKPSQLKVLNRMKELEYDFEGIKTVREGFETSNILDAKSINSLVRKITECIKRSDPDHQYLEELLRTCTKTLSEQDSPMTVSDANGVLYFTENPGE